MAQSLTRPMATEMLERLSGIPRQAEPRWGKMNPLQMIGHLTEVFRYTLGDGQDMPFAGNFKSRTLYTFLLLYGIADFPKNVQLPDRKGAGKRPRAVEGNMDDLADAVECYLESYGAGTLSGRIHPFFGEMSVQAWRRFHFYHTRHHMRQFGMEPHPSGMISTNSSISCSPKRTDDGCGNRKETPVLRHRADRGFPRRFGPW